MAKYTVDDIKEYRKMGIINEETANQLLEAIKATEGDVPSVYETDVYESGTTEYELKYLVDKYGLPLKVKMPRFYGDFYFLAEKIDERRRMIDGSQFSGGRYYRSKSYSYSELCCLLNPPPSPEKNVATANDQGNNSWEREQAHSGKPQIETSELANPNKLELDKSKYKKGKTALFVVKNSKLLPAVFDRFELKNGKEVIYVDCQGELTFFPFPQTVYVFPNKDDGNKAMGKSNRLYGRSTDSQYIIDAYGKQPISQKPLPEKSEELKVERAYHNKVDSKLCQNLISPKKELARAQAETSSVERDFKQQCIDARENGGIIDQHSLISQQMHYSSAQQRHQSALDKVNKIEAIRVRPYFGRVDCGRSIKELHTAYIGDTDIPGYVVDWRHPEIGNIYYHSATFQSRDDIVIALKRVIDIMSGSFVDFADEINIYHSAEFKPNDAEIAAGTDDLLTRLLKASREDKKAHDIIKTIQGEQYDIITSDFLRNAVINGCAGSGKTMIMYHRLSYMAYNYQHREGKPFDEQKVFVISPSVYFDLSNTELLKKLSISKVVHASFDKQLTGLIHRYCREKGILPFIGLLLEKNKDTVDTQNIYSKAVCEEYLKSIDEGSKSTSHNEEFRQWIYKKIRTLLEENGFLLNEQSLSNNVFAVLYWDECHKKDNPSDVSASDIERNYERAKKAITGISFDNVEAALAKQNPSSKTRSKREKKIECYYDVLMLCLSTKTRKLSNSNASTDIGDFWTVLEQTERLEKLTALIIAEKLLKAAQDQDGQQDLYYLLQCEFFFEKFFGSLHNEIAPTYYLYALHQKYGPIVPGESFIFVDEFQNYAPFELECIRGAFEKPIFNLYGDFDQRIESKGLALQEELDSLLSPDMYNINVNYRNAKQITQYINKSVHKNMQSIGVDGTVEETLYGSCNFDIHNRTAIVAKDRKLIQRLLRQRDDKDSFVPIDKDPGNENNIIVMDVNECKGLEFDTVYVFTDEMSENEKYVAFTRALDRLVVITDSNLREIQREDEKGSKQPDQPNDMNTMQIEQPDTSYDYAVENSASEEDRGNQYWEALQKFTSDNISDLESAIHVLKDLDGWRDSLDKIAVFEEKIQKLKLATQKDLWKANKQCQHCGGSFKGLFVKTCRQCGKRKDY